MSIKETINNINAIFHKTTNLDELQKATNTIKEVIANPVINEENKNLATALYYRIQLKHVLLKYFDTLSFDDYKLAQKFINNVLKSLSEENFPKTYDLYKKGNYLLTTVCSIYKEYCYEYEKLFDSYGDVVVTNTKTCNEVINELTKAIEQLPLISLDSPFNESVSFVDALEMLTTMFTSLLKATKNIKSGIEKKAIKKFLDENSEPLTKAFPPTFDYFPEVDSDQQRLSKTIIISSPILEEVYLFTSAYANLKNLTIYVFNANIFANKEVDEIEQIFSSFASQSISCLIVGLNSYHDKNRENLLITIMRCASIKSNIFIHDIKGDRAIYNEALEMCKKTDGLDITNISHFYLSMPLYANLIDIFIEHEMIKFGDVKICEEIKTKMPFMGFVGLNKVIKAAIQGESWIDIGYEQNKKNDTKTLHKYIDNIPNQIQFIDFEWGNFTEKRDEIIIKRTKFDYDTIRDVNKENIRQIMESEYDLITKCGLLSRYAILAGDDISKWTTLPKSEHVERITLATKLIFNMLGIDIDPIVIVEDDIGKNVAGLCCEGGKLIKYQTDHVVKNPMDLIDTICHESRHAFQHMASSNAYQPWYFDELGVSEGEVMQWAYNFREKYFQPSDNKKAYMVQIAESDARAFAFDCKNAADKTWAKLNLK